MLIIPFFSIEAKKVRHSLRIDKETSVPKKKKNEISGKMVTLTDSTISLDNEMIALIDDLKRVGFAGYEKEVNSSRETFIIINTTDTSLCGFEVRVIYQDMQGRMLHSRIIKEECKIPKGETRKLDINSWDLQHTYYYYLGNQPKKVATPFQVKFEPLTFWVE